MSYFIFQPSLDLAQKIQQIIHHRQQSQPLYPLRNEIILQMNDEMIELLLTGLIRNLREGEKKDIAAKLAQYSKSTLRILLQQLLTKEHNQDVNRSIDYLQTMLYNKNHLGQVQTNPLATDSLYIAMPMPTSLSEQIISLQQQILQHQTIDSKVLAQCYIQFADLILKYFIQDFQKTLNLGLLKRKASEMTLGAMSKAIHLATNQIIPHLKPEDLITFANYYQHIFYNEQIQHHTSI